MTWTEEISVEDSGKVYYKGIEVELTCENLMNLIKQGNAEETLEKEVVEFVRNIKLDILLSKS
jgi:hypothetical protein